MPGIMVVNDVYFVRAWGKKPCFAPCTKHFSVSGMQRYNFTSVQTGGSDTFHSIWEKGGFFDKMAGCVCASRKSGSVFCRIEVVYVTTRFI